MSKNKNNTSQGQKSLKLFFIKLASICIAVVIIVNLVFNIIFAERLEKIDKVLLLDKKEFRIQMKEKIRNELNDALDKENIINEDDKILLYKIYLKIKKEFDGLDKSQL
tara:strand:- start:1 stop:327 length:327 start_codon:yes stop_codon:yes gene_type:complete